MIIAGIIVAIIAVIMIGAFNSMTRKRNQITNAFAGIDVQLKKRVDLIPNIIASVKGYMTHEKELLTNLTQLRASALRGSSSRSEIMKLDGDLKETMGSINVAVENYPDLKSNENFIQLQKTLLIVEEQLSASRRFYNSAVTDYNNAIMVFPNNLLANMFNFTKEEVFAIKESERENVNVKELFK